MKELSVNIYFINAVLEQAKHQGHNIDRLLRRSRISPRLIKEQHARVSVEQFARLQALTMLEMDDEMLGYSAYPLKTGQWFAVCHWLVTSKTLGQALKRYCRFYEIVESGLQPNLRTTKEHVSLVFSPRPEDKGRLKPYAYELYMFNAHRLICWLTDSLPTTDAATFSYPQPPHIDEYHQMFLGAPIHFDGQVCSLSFNRELLGLRVAQTQETLANFLRNPIYNILVNPYQNLNWSEKIKALIGKDLSGLPSFLEIAARLEINPKRLRRLLKEEGLTYSDLKLQLRRDIAINHLSQQDTSVEEIAYKTGFSESSAFIRAFKTWTGVTPYTYRKDLA